MRAMMMVALLAIHVQAQLGQPDHKGAVDILREAKFMARKAPPADRAKALVALVGIAEASIRFQNARKLSDVDLKGPGFGLATMAFGIDREQKEGIDLCKKLVELEDAKQRLAGFTGMADAGQTIVSLSDDLKKIDGLKDLGESLGELKGNVELMRMTSKVLAEEVKRREGEVDRLKRSILTP